MYPTPSSSLLILTLSSSALSMLFLSIQSMFKFFSLTISFIDPELGWISSIWNSLSFKSLSRSSNLGSTEKIWVGLDKEATISDTVALDSISFQGILSSLSSLPRLITSNPKLDSASSVTIGATLLPLTWESLSLNEDGTTKRLFGSFYALICHHHSQLNLGARYEQEWGFEGL